MIPRCKYLILKQCFLEHLSKLVVYDTLEKTLVGNTTVCSFASGSASFSFPIFSRSEQI